MSMVHLDHSQILSAAPPYSPAYGNVMPNWVMAITGKYNNISVDHDARLCSSGLWVTSVEQGTMLHAGKPWVRFSIRSVTFSVST
jgi:hypothetical protein